MAGVPYHSASSILARLLKLGESVVIAEQDRRPAGAARARSNARWRASSAGYAGPIRAAGRNLRHPDSRHRPTSRSVAEFAWLNLAAGAFRSAKSTPAPCPPCWRAVRPAESSRPDDFALSGAPCAVRRLAPWQFDSTARTPGWRSNRQPRPQRFGVADLRSHWRRGCAARLHPDHATHRAAAYTKHPRRARQRFVQLDAATRVILNSPKPCARASPTLLSVRDTTATGMGTRLLRHWLHHPLRDREILTQRRDASGDAGRAARHCERPYPLLKSCADVERISAALR